MRSLFWVVIFAACGSDADKLALDGADALKNCDIRTAHDKFTQAHDADPNHPQAALGFALTDLALLPEDPVVTEVLGRFGFTSAIDMQVLVFGADGVLAREGRGDTCDAINTFVNTTIPYPPLADTTIAGSTLIDPTLTGDDILVGLDALSPRLERIAAALETAAANDAEPVDVEGGCGLGKVTFQAPELYAAAALIEVVRHTIQLARVYDWQIGIRDYATIIDGPTLATMLDAHVGHVVDAGQGGAARDMLGRAIELADKAVDAAKVATAQPDGLFDWTAFPGTMLDDVRRMVDSIGATLQGRATIADVAPALTLDAGPIYTNPIDFAKIATPLFTSSVGSTSFSISSQTLDTATAMVFSPSLYASPAYTWVPQPTWNAFDFTPVTKPFDRFMMIYTCRAVVP